jgi:short-subunit dehydrogenase
VITGASSGFGRGTAIKLAHQGANVFLAARRKEVLEELAGEIGATGGTAVAVGTDVSDSGDVANLAAAAVGRHGGIDIWINNVGVGARPVLGHSDRVHARLVDVNLKGLIFGAHMALWQFWAQGGGTLINVGSMDSEVALAYQASYAATKAAVLSLSRSLTEELRLAGNEAIRSAPSCCALWIRRGGHTRQITAATPLAWPPWTTRRSWVMPSSRPAPTRKSNDPWV